MTTTGPGQSALLFLNIVPILDNAKVPYAVIGAFAASYYGVVRASLDADALIAVLPEDIPEFLKKLKKKNFKVAYQRGDFKDPVSAVINIEDKFGNRVDLLLGIRGMESRLFDRAVKATFIKSVIKIVGLEDFIAMKISAGSAKDMADAQGVMEVSRAKINFPLLKDLTSRYGKTAAQKLDKLLANLE